MRRIAHAVSAAIATACLLAATTATASADPALSAKHYAQLDAALTALIPLDAERVSAAAFVTAGRTCGALDAADPLLSALRRSCITTVRAERATDAFGRCSTAAGCRTTSVATRRALDQTAAPARAANKAIAASALGVACKSTLRTPAKQLRATANLSAALVLLEHGLRTRSQRDLSRAQRRIAAVQRDTRDLPSNREQRASFRAACGPAPPAAAA